MIRSASLRLVPAIAALCAAGSLAALDHEQAFSPFVASLGGPEGSPYNVDLQGGFESKVIDDGRDVHDDAALNAKGKFRAYGFGLGLDTDWALGEAQDPSRARKTNPGEMVRFEATVDWALEVRDPKNPKVPLLQVIPHFNYITYPSQGYVYGPDNNSYLKRSQRWLGADVWWMTPADGVELGGSVEQNLSSQWRATRAWLGAREFTQTNAIDLSFWQTLGFGDSEYRWVTVGKDRTGVDAADIGGRATMPFSSLAKGLFSFVQLDISYWLQKSVRDTLKDAGQDGGNVVISVGVEWQPE